MNTISVTVLVALAVTKVTCLQHREGVFRKIKFNENILEKDKWGRSKQITIESSITDLGYESLMVNDYDSLTPTGPKSPGTRSLFMPALHSGYRNEDEEYGNNQLSDPATKSITEKADPVEKSTDNTDELTDATTRRSLLNIGSDDPNAFSIVNRPHKNMLFFSMIRHNPASSADAKQSASKDIHHRPASENTDSANVMSKDTEQKGNGPYNRVLTRKQFKNFLNSQVRTAIENAEEERLSTVNTEKLETDASTPRNWQDPNSKLLVGTDLGKKLYYKTDYGSSVDDLIQEGVFEGKTTDKSKPDRYADMLSSYIG